MLLLRVGFKRISPVLMEEKKPAVKQTDEPREGFLPDFCNSHNVFLVVLMSELLALMLTLAPGMETENFWRRLAFISLFIQWVSLTAIFLLCYFRKWFDHGDSIKSAAISYATSLVLTFLYSLAAIWVLKSLGMLNPDSAWTSSFIQRNLVICAIVSAVVLRYFYVQSQWKTNTEAEARSRIQALQARIRPHFLFNSMNTIASLTRTHPEEAERAVEDLADLFRVSLADRNMLSLGEEVEVTKRYLNIEGHRLGDRLQVDWQIDPSVDLRTEIPALILQPLVENALYHGIEPLTEGGVVTIALKKRGSSTRISVSNPLSDKTDQRQHKGNKMAQDNIRQRLALAYSLESPMKVEDTGKNYTVAFNIPGK